MNAKKVLASIIIVAALWFGSNTPFVSEAHPAAKNAVTIGEKRKTKKPAKSKTDQAPVGATAECRDGTYKL